MSTNAKKTNAIEGLATLQLRSTKNHESLDHDGDAMTLGTIAYVDESIRMAADPPTYLVAATIPMQDGQLAPFEALFQRGARKLHWRDMPPPLRKKSVRTIAKMDHLTTVVAAAPLDYRKQERARKKCLGILLPALEELGVSQAILESRDRKGDLRDVETAKYLRRQGTISEIRVSHAGTEEHGLWLPDQILGAYGDTLCGTPDARSWGDDWSLALASIDVMEIST